MGSNPIGPTGSARLVAQLAEDGGQPHGPAHAGDGLLYLPAGLLGARDDEVLAAAWVPVTRRPSTRPLRASNRARRSRIGARNRLTATASRSLTSTSPTVPAR